MNISIKENEKSQTYGITPTFKTLKYLSLIALLDLSWVAEFFTILSLVTLKLIFYLHFKVFDKLFKECFRAE